MTYSSTLAYYKYTINFSYFYSTYAKRQVFENHTAMMAWYHFRAEKKYSGKKINNIQLQQQQRCVFNNARNFT